MGMFTLRISVLIKNVGIKLLIVFCFQIIFLSLFNLIKPSSSDIIKDSSVLINTYVYYHKYKLITTLSSFVYLTLVLTLLNLERWFLSVIEAVIVILLFYTYPIRFILVELNNALLETEKIFIVQLTVFIISILMSIYFSRKFID